MAEMTEHIRERLRAIARNRNYSGCNCDLCLFGALGYLLTREEKAEVLSCGTELTDLRRKLADAEAEVARLSRHPLRCYDCGLHYSSDSWCDAVVPDDVWLQIGPFGDGGGVLCFNCIAGRCAKRGITTPIKITSGPFTEVTNGRC